MISFAEAQRILREQVIDLPREQVQLHQVLGRYLAAPVVAAYDHPRFDNSAMDGFALGSIAIENKFEVVGEVAAGDVWNDTLGPQQCVRIFTGAAVPKGTAAVVMQERCERSGDHVTVETHHLLAGANIRQKGEEVKAGSQVMQAGECVDPAAVGLLASLGIDHVTTYTIPRVGVLITGGEFTDPTSPQEGRIFNSNGPMLQALLHQQRITAQSQHHVIDDPQQLTKALHELLQSCDVVITTGGVSVGDHDHIPRLVKQLGLSIHFHKVAQKPGKPMMFAKGEGKALFGLPGNPRAVYMAWWIHVLPYLQRLQGTSSYGLRSDDARLAHDVQLNGERIDLQVGNVRDGKVELLGKQRSHMLSTLVNADVIVELPTDRPQLFAGDPVRVHWLP